MAVFERSLGPCRPRTRTRGVPPSDSREWGGVSCRATRKALAARHLKLDRYIQMADGAAPLVSGGGGGARGASRPRRRQVASLKSESVLVTKTGGATPRAHPPLPGGPPDARRGGGHS